MEPLGQKLQQARLAKKITVEEASRVTKIRPSRIHEIEQEDFSSFASLAYAKGFLLIYGKYLNVDVTPYLDAFEISDRVTVDGYSYLQDSGPTAPPPIVRRQPRQSPAFLPFLVAVAVLVIGLYLIKLFLNLQRITPPRERAPNPATASVSATAAPFTQPPPGQLAVPGVQSAEGPPASEAQVAGARTPIPTAAPAISAPTEPEVRRALPVNSEDLVPPAVTPTGVNRVEIKPVRKTHLRVTVDNNIAPAFDGWLDSSDAPLSFQGRRVMIKVLERGSVQIFKNGAALAMGDTDVTVE